MSQLLRKTVVTQNFTRNLHWCINNEKLLQILWVRYGFVNKIHNLRSREKMTLSQFINFLRIP